MISSEKIKNYALEVFKNAYNGFTYDEWCNTVQEEFKDVDVDQIRKVVKNIIDTYWKVEHIIEKDEKIYIYHDLIK